MSSSEAMWRLGSQLPLEINEEAAQRIRRDVHRRMFKKSILMLSTAQVDECIEIYNEAIDKCRIEGGRLRRISVVRRSKRAQSCYGMLLDWVASDGDPLPKLVVLEHSDDATESGRSRRSRPVKVDLVVTPPILLTIRSKLPENTVGHGTEFMHLQWSLE